MKVKDGDIITFYGISWNDGWQFGKPNIILSPVIRYTDSYSSVMEVIEELCIDLCVDQCIESEDENCEDWRGWGIDSFREYAINSFKKEGNVALPPYFKDLIEDFKADEDEDDEVKSDEYYLDIINLSVSKIAVEFTNANDDYDPDLLDFNIINEEQIYYDETRKTKKQ